MQASSEPWQRSMQQASKQGVGHVRTAASRSMSERMPAARASNSAAWREGTTGLVPD